MFFKLLIYTTLLVVYFALGCEYGKNIAISEELGYNIEDPNLDPYYDRDSFQEESYQGD